MPQRRRKRLSQFAERVAQALQAPEGELETPCPDAQTLRRYQESTLDPVAAEAVVAHLAQCAVCRWVAAGALVAPGKASKG